MSNRIFTDEQLLAIAKSDTNEIKQELKTLSKLKNWLGTTTTEITVDSTVNPIVISGESVTAQAGDVVAYNSNEFIYSEAGTWQIYDDMLDVYTKDEVDSKFIQNEGNTLSDGTITNIKRQGATYRYSELSIDGTAENPNTKLSTVYERRTTKVATTPTTAALSLQTNDGSASMGVEAGQQGNPISANIYSHSAINITSNGQSSGSGIHIKSNGSYGGIDIEAVNDITIASTNGKFYYGTATAVNEVVTVGYLNSLIGDNISY